MPSAKRRSFLASLGTAAIGGLAGCSFTQPDAPPAGSLRFENRDGLPHSITLRVTDIGERPGSYTNTVEGEVAALPAQRNLTASVTLPPGERRTYPGVFTEPAWYAVQFTVDGTLPDDDAGETVFHPAPPDRRVGCFLSGTVDDSGRFRWGINSTDNAGSFTIGGSAEG